MFVSSNTCSQMHVQIKHSLAHLQDLMPTLAGIITLAKVGIEYVDVATRKCFVHMFGYMCLN